MYVTLKVLDIRNLNEAYKPLVNFLTVADKANE